jgi:hypothetical protein
MALTLVHAFFFDLVNMATKFLATTPYIEHWKTKKNSSPVRKLVDFYRFLKLNLKMTSKFIFRRPGLSIFKMKFGFI